MHTIRHMTCHRTSARQPQGINLILTAIATAFSVERDFLALGNLILELSVFGNSWQPNFGVVGLWQDKCINFSSFYRTVSLY